MLKEIRLLNDERNLFKLSDVQTFSLKDPLLGAASCAEIFNKAIIASTAVTSILTIFKQVEIIFLDGEFIVIGGIAENTMNSRN